MAQRVIRLLIGASVSLFVIAICVRLNPALLEKSRWSRPALRPGLPPEPSGLGFRVDVERTWHPPETFNFYRGSETRDGIYREGRLSPPLKIEWTTDAFNIGVHGASKSSPAVDASGVYVGSDSGWIRAYAHDGQLRWKFKVAGAVRGIHSTPLLSKERVYIGSYGGTFYVLDKADGSLVWTFHHDEIAFGSSPFVVDDHLIAAIETQTLNSYLVALDPKDGRVLWRSPFLGEQLHASPAFDRATNSLLVGANNKMFYAISAVDGRILWRTFLAGEIKSTPLIVEGVVYVTSWAGKLHALQIRDGRPLWDSPLGGLSQSSPTRIPGTDVLVVGDSKGFVSGIDRRDGRRLWRIERKEMILSSALAAQTDRGEWLAWMGCGQDSVCGFEPRRGRLVQTIPLGAQLTGVPVAYNGSLYVSLNYPGGLVKLASPNVRGGETPNF